MSREKWIKMGILLLIDMVVINFAYIVGFMFKVGFMEGIELYKLNLNLIPLLMVAYIIPLYSLNMYRSVWRVAGIDEGVKGLIASIMGVIVTYIFSGLGYKLSLEIVLIAFILIFMLTVGARLSFRVLRRLFIFKELKNNNRTDKVMIIGAGASASIIIAEMLKNKESNMVPVCIIDDNKAKLGKRINGIEIIGNRNDIKKLVVEKNIKTIIFAISVIKAEEKRKILEICGETKVKLKIVPGVTEIFYPLISL